MKPFPPVDVLIIGAGMAGLAAARCCRMAGLSVIVLDKGRGVGGRIATRRIETADGVGGAYDHGAQFVSARDQHFRMALLPWIRHKALRPWAMLDDDASALAYVGDTGMNLLAKGMAGGIDVRLSQHVTRILPASSGWRVIAKQGETFHAHALLLTAPAEQSLAILDGSRVPLADDQRQALHAVTYTRCLAGLFVLDRPSGLPKPGAKRFDDQDLIWLADNRMKGISPDLTTVTAHASPTFSERWWTLDKRAVESALTRRVSREVAGTIVHAQFHGWRYARAVQSLPGPFLTLSEKPRMLFAGDAFIRSTIEGAFLSGSRAGEELVK
ncbi:MAG: FAD-dependent oxidoreductase, partial [Verrucomicrobia bacterium]|nr:FAD-dependent oxidoreductase [Verrucomicrobiota bacterium]